MAAKVAWFDRDPAFPRQFRSGVSIHSHTSRSRESLEFVACVLESHPLTRRFLNTQSTAASRAGIALDLRRGYWTPPLSPRSAYELERRQIESLGLEAMVSLSDHDSIEAAQLLHVVPAMRQAPISLEWTLPFQSSKFHLGVHNLPTARAQELYEEMMACTAAPSTEAACDLLRTLHAIPGVLVVFNHPLWNLYANPVAVFQQDLEDFLALNNGVLHAFELNGLRRWEENLRVGELAGRWQQILISGGDRHGCEPNANLNLTAATSFDEWVNELRVARSSQVLFLPQYSHSLVARCYSTFLDAIRDLPQNSDGTARWDRRTFHPDREGVVRPLAELWQEVPPVLAAILNFARLAESTHLLDRARIYFGKPARNLAGISGQEESA